MRYSEKRQFSKTLFADDFSSLGGNIPLFRLPAVSAYSQKFFINIVKRQANAVIFNNNFFFFV